MKTAFRNLFLFAFCSFFLLHGCKEDTVDEVVDANLNFKTQVSLSSDDLLYEVGDTLRMSTGYDFNLKKFKLYLSNLTLISDAAEIEVMDIFLADVGNEQTGAFSLKVKAGKYHTIRLGLGLDPEQNNSLPEDFENEHPLSSYNQMYWTMLKYRFAILEGRSDSTGQLNGDNSDILNAYHPGLDTLYRVVEYPINLDLSAGDTQTIVLKVILDELFSHGDGIDMRTEAQSHSEQGNGANPGDFNIALKFMNNLSETARLELQ